jgi:hypothetical protein
VLRRPTRSASNAATRARGDASKAARKERRFHEALFPGSIHRFVVPDRRARGARDRGLEALRPARHDRAGLRHRRHGFVHGEPESGVDPQRGVGIWRNVHRVHGQLLGQRRSPGELENPAGWASVEAHAEVDGEFYVSSTPASLAHDTVVEVRCALLPNGRVRAEITDSRVFPDSSGSVSGTAYVLGTGGQLSTTIQLSGIPQKYFYAEVQENGGGDRCIDQFTIHWRTEGDAFLWVDDGILFSGQADYTMHGDSTTSIVLGVCPNCTGSSKQ